MSNVLMENLMHNDLDGLLLPLVSVDRFVPKTGDSKDVAVVVFYAISKESAQDLSDFLKFSAVGDIKDVDISPNPDPESRYLVFVEMDRNKELYGYIRDLCDDVNRLGNVQEWKLQPYLTDDEFPLDSEEWEQYVPARPRDYISREDYEEQQAQKRKQQREQNVREFFVNSNALDVQVEENLIHLTDHYGTNTLKLVNMGAGEQVMQESQLGDLAINYDFEPNLTETLGVLAGEIQVVPIGSNFVFYNPVTEQVLIAEPI